MTHLYKNLKMSTQKKMTILGSITAQHQLREIVDHILKDYAQQH